VISRNSVNSGLVQSLDNVEDHKIMRKIREQLMQGKAMMRRLSDMGSEHDELIRQETGCELVIVPLGPVFPAAAVKCNLRQRVMWG
jgi:hypothetical protein